MPFVSTNVSYTMICVSKKFSRFHGSCLIWKLSVASMGFTQ